jgi:5-(carboxyamino)imidazole ribonucleotide mutase
MEIESITLTEFGVAHETRSVSAHRTPVLLFKFAKSADKQGIEVIKTENPYNFTGAKGYSA